MANATGPLIHVVTGAPGSGKSMVLDAFLRLRTEYLAFDIDWLIYSTSALSGRSIVFDRSSWTPFRVLWMDVLRAVYRNSRVPVLFANLDIDDMRELEPIEWVGGVRWLLLDCDDATRARRLTGRPMWTPAQTTEAIRDAGKLRRTIPESVNTSTHPPESIALVIRDWMAGTR